jgi:hypothetical protein
MMLPGTPGCAVCEAKAVAARSVMPPVMVAANAPPAGGYAVAGEPVPVGVVQASYRPTGAAGATASAPGHAVVGPAVPSDPSAWSASNTTTLSHQRHHHPQILLHLFGLREFESPFEVKKEKAKERHAAIAYGPNTSSVTELPASMVYGSGGR